MTIGEHLSAICELGLLAECYNTKIQTLLDVKDD